MFDSRPQDELPVAVIGAGPVGLATAAHLVSRGIEPLVLEAGARPGSAVSSWGHVQLFTPWEMNVDRVAHDLLKVNGWDPPPRNRYPTGAELVDLYLEPLAATRELAPRLRLGRRVIAVTRLGFDKLRTDGRGQAPFQLVSTGPRGVERHLARALIDASGTVGTPNPVGAGGVPAVGEMELSAHIAYGHQDILGRARADYGGQRVLVVGSGHSALGALLDLTLLREEHPETEILWAVRRKSISDYFAGTGSDQLPARGRLARLLADRFEQLTAFAGFTVQQLAKGPEGIVASDESHELPPVDRITAATGYRPDLSLLRELRVEMDPGVESPPALAPMIDPNLHSCATVPAHGVDELAHPEPNLFIVGMKSYGRAPTFLMKTGYEQVRSIAAALAGDWETARRADLVLPQGGACSGADDQQGACCRPSTPEAELPVSAGGRS